MEQYSPDQLDKYFDRIVLNRHNHTRHDTLDFLSVLLRQHTLQVPFETVELHYSPDKEVSLSPDALFDKIVTRRRGGYCFELNSFFGLILQSLGFKVTYVGCRMANRTVKSQDISRWKVLCVPCSTFGSVTSHQWLTRPFM